MDACGIERIVNITMQTGDAALAVLHRFHSAAPERFSTMGWMDWSGIEQPDFFRKSVDRLELLVEHGACGLKMWKDLGLTVRDASGQLLRIDDERLAPIFEKAAELRIPVMFHTADPDAFFFPSISTTSDMRSWPPTPIGVSTELSTRSRSCWSSATASSPAIPQTHLRSRPYGRVGGVPEPRRRGARHLPECFRRYERPGSRAWGASLIPPASSFCATRPHPLWRGPASRS
jgi:hypothetical protein